MHQWLLPNHFDVPFDLDHEHRAELLEASRTAFVDRAYGASRASPECRSGALSGDNGRGQESGIERSGWFDGSKGRSPPNGSLRGRDGSGRNGRMTEGNSSRDAAVPEGSSPQSFRRREGASRYRSDPHNPPDPLNPHNP